MDSVSAVQAALALESVIPELEKWARKFPTGPSMDAIRLLVMIRDGAPMSAETPNPEMSHA